MSQQFNGIARPPNVSTSHRRFARNYERISREGSESRFLLPLRAEVTAATHGRVLEVGAGNGLNFALYSPESVERVDAVEPDSAMLAYARPRADAARVPVSLFQAGVERLPFADESFDSAIATLVFCSVGDPLRGLREVRRVLRPGGVLLMVEHVRGHGAVALLQNIVTPVSRWMAGNCHWNRETGRTVRQAGFTIERQREIKWSLMPFVVLHALK